jgi:hypothetical protein
VHVGLTADCAFEPASPFRIWLFSPLKLSRERITTFISVSVSVDFHRPLLPRSFNNRIETHLVSLGLERKNPRRGRSFPKKTKSHRWSTALRRSSAGQPLGLLGSTNLGRCILTWRSASSGLQYADLARRVPVETWIESSHDLDRPRRAHDPSNGGAPEC